jgi:OOP family OmpA-OmpF porin
MRKVVVAAVALGGMAVAQSAQAQDQLAGWYGQISAGALQLLDSEGSSGGVSVDIDHKLGFIITGAIGYGFGNGFRAELEFGYGQSKFDDVKINGMKGSLNGTVDHVTGYLAAYYEFNTGMVKPYLGGGLGAVYSDVGKSTATVGGVTASINGDDDISFSAFGEVGAAIDISKGFAIVPSVRYIWINDGGDGFDDNEAWVARLGLRFKL